MALLRILPEYSPNGYIPLLFLGSEAFAKNLVSQ
jgi:hypothetical protein